MSKCLAVMGKLSNDNLVTNGETLDTVFSERLVIN